MHHLPVALAFLVLVSGCGEVAEDAATDTASQPVTTQAVGWLDSQLEVGPNGSAQASIPLEVPRGRAGVEPSLALVYSSHGGNGLLGVGWTLSGLSSITRCPRSYAQDGEVRGPDFTAGDPFCLDGARLVAVSGGNGGEETRYRTQRDSSTEVKSLGVDAAGPRSFVVRTPDGRILTFGHAPSMDGVVEGREQRGDGPPLALRRYAWLLKRVEDRSGNYLTVTYQHHMPAPNEPGLGYWPVRIDYTGSASSAPNRSVVFEYEARPDVITGWLSGLPLRIDNRLAVIRMNAPSVAGQAPLLVRTYRMTYDTSPTSGRSRLTDVRQCDPSDACLAPAHFAYSAPAPRFELASAVPVNAAPDQVMVGDFTGDGRDDVLYQNGPGYVPPPYTNVPTPANPWVLRPGMPPGGPGVGGPLPFSFKTTKRPIVWDHDGDGFPDLLSESVKISVNPNKYRALRYRGVSTGFAAQEILSTSTVSTQSGIGPRPGVMWDLDGDLVSDKSVTARSAPEYVALGRTEVLESGVTAHDLDGDHHLELLVPAARPGSTGYFYDALTKRGRLGSVEVRPTNLAWDPCAMFVDVNGDGLDDAVTLRSGVTVRINLGNTTFAAPYDGFDASGGPFAGISTACDVQPPEATTIGPGLDSGARVVDLNQDGRQDLLLIGITDDSQYARALVSDGTKLKVVLLNPGNPIHIDVPDAQTKGAAASQTLDVNGDGLFDFLQLTYGGELHVWIQDARHADLLVEASGPPRRLIEYGTVMAPPSTPCVYPTRCLRSPMLVTARTWTDPAGAGWVLESTHAYAEARADVQGGGFLGFARHTATHDPTGTTTEVLYSQELDLDPLAAASGRRHPYRGLPVKTTVSRANLRSVTTNTWNKVVNVVTTLPYVATYFPYLEISNVTEYEGTQVLRSTTTTTTEVDAFAHPRIVTVDRGAGFSTTTETEYLNDPTQWLIGLPVLVTVTSTTPDSTEYRKVQSDYDETTGLQTGSIVEPDRPALYLSETYTRDGLGNITGVTRTDTDEVSRTSSMTYDADAIFPIGSVNALGHTTTTTWAPGLGVPLSVTDANGLQTAMQYDGFGRLRQRTSPDGSTANITLTTSPELPLIETITTSTGGRVTVSRDRLGREVLRATLGRMGQELRVATAYDAAGRVSSITRPYPAGGSPVTAVAYEYDPAGRVRFERRADGTFVKHVYTGRLTDTYDETCQWPQPELDPSCVWTQTELDAAGRVAATRIYPDGPADPDGAEVTTTFAYGPFDKNVRVTDALGNVVRMKYDALGRTIEITDKDLAPSGVPRTYAYNAFGELVSQIDGKGVKTTMTYDALGRPLTRTALGVVDQWTWDTAAGAGKGQLASTARGGVVKALTYDALGRPSSQLWTVDGASYTFDYTYDALGRLARTAYPVAPGRPARFAIAPVYDAASHVTALRDEANHLVWSASAVDAEGRVSSEQLGNGLVTNRAWSPLTGRLLQVTSSIPSYAHDLSYVYEPNGNLRSRRDAWQDRTESFTYDGANRLTKSEVSGGGPTAQFTYDAIGNLLTSTDYLPGCSLAYGGPGAGPHALTTVACATASQLTYDGNGNMLSSPRDGMQATWTSFDKPLELANLTGRVRFTYDADHTRIKKETLTFDPAQSQWWQGFSGVWATTLDLGDYEKRSGQQMGTRTDHVFTVSAEGRPIAQLTWRWDGSTGQDVWRYLHTDAQGSPSRTTDANGSMAELASNDAWGARRHHDWSQPAGSIPRDTRISYTGHQHDDELGLVDMGARLYHPVFKRFLSPDTVVQAPLYGPSWNRYSYVFNNPLRYTDPTGHVAFGSLTSPVLGSPGMGISTMSFFTGLSMFQIGAAAHDSRVALSLDQQGRVERANPRDAGPEAHGFSASAFASDGVGWLADYIASESTSSSAPLACNCIYPGKRESEFTTNVVAGFLDHIWNWTVFWSPGRSLLEATNTPYDPVGQFVGMVTGIVAETIAGGFFRSLASAAPPAARAGALRWIGNGVWESTGGLRYGADPNFGNRVLHLLNHAADVPARNGMHGVFDAGRTGVLGVVDEGWALVQQGSAAVVRTVQQGPRTVYTIDMGQRIGWVGGQGGAALGNPAASHLQLVVEGRNFITAYPILR